MGRFTLIMVTGFAIIAAAMKLSMQDLGRKSAEISTATYEEKAARRSAHSAAELALRNLKDDLDWRGGCTNLSLANSNVTVNVIDSSTDSTLGMDTVRIESQSYVGGESAAVIMEVALGHPDFPPNITAGATARANVGTLGQMVVDGRNHDMNGNLIADDGLLAIKTTHAYVCGGSSELAGTTAGGTDYGPVSIDYESIVEEHFVWPGIYPSTPEAVLGGAENGLFPGILKAVAQSGVNGSQYVTDPTNLTYPLSGVTYVEMPYDGIWNPVILEEEASGLLIVHNAWCNSLMKNVDNRFPFRGLIIADDMVHVHNDNIGAVFLLTPFPMEGNCLGNGMGRILFSRRSVIKSLEDASLGLTNVSVVGVYE